MGYLTFNKLSNQTFQKAEVINESRGFSLSASKVVFLSYRRKDKEYVKPIVDLLHSLKVKVYVDYLDEHMPDTPSSKTASLLRERIKKSDKFIMVSTPNSKDSKWIPWELGLGDGFDGYENAIILPVTNNTLIWAEQEYFEIYGYVKEADSTDKSKTDWAIFYPDRKPIWLSDWLKS
jgi:hypothetical protein